MTVGNTVFFVRAIPSVDIYEVIELTIRSSGDGWAVGVDSDTKQAFSFHTEDFETLLFNSKKEAEEVLKEKKGERNERKQK